MKLLPYIIPFVKDAAKSVKHIWVQILRNHMPLIGACGSKGSAPSSITNWLGLGDLNVVPILPFGDKVAFEKIGVGHLLKLVGVDTVFHVELPAGPIPDF